MSHIGERIKERRIALGLTQEELAKKLGYKSKSTINKIEMGINDVSHGKIELFAKALDTTPAELIGYYDFNNFDKNIIQNNKKLDKALMEISKSTFFPNIENLEHLDIDKRIEMYNLLYEHVVYDEEADEMELYPYIPPVELMTSYNKLNTQGKAEAIKRINELTELPKYTNPDVNSEKS